MRTYYGAFMRRRAVSGSLQLLDATYNKTSFDPNPATARFTINSDGTAVGVGTATPGAAQSYNWLTGGSAADYQVRATISSGDFNLGTDGTWVDCSTSPTWNVKDPSSHTTVTALFEIRRVSDSVVVASATITMTATMI